MRNKRDSLTPQCRTLLDHMQKGLAVTQRSALMDFGIMSLPRRICDLKNHGYKIKSVMTMNPFTKQRFARYTMVN